MMKKTLPTGFTLIELMIVVVILAVLAAIAYPNYQAYIVQSRRADAQQAILQLANRLEKFFTVCNEYTTNITGTWPTAYSSCPSQGGAAGLAWPATSPENYYTLSVEAGPTGDIATSYLITATPAAGSTQVGDGNFRMDSTGLKQWDRNNNGTYEASENTWEKYK